jgi:hypothetical protein
MPMKGDINTRFGVYVNHCCGAEILIPENLTFPGCAEHIHPDTQWRLVPEAEMMRRLHKMIQGAKARAASRSGRD